MQTIKYCPRADFHHYDEITLRGRGFSATALDYWPWETVRAWVVVGVGGGMAAQTEEISGDLRRGWAEVTLTQQVWVPVLVVPRFQMSDFSAWSSVSPIGRW